MSKQALQIVDLPEYTDIKEILSRKIQSYEDLGNAVADLSAHDVRLDVAKVQLRWVIGQFLVKYGKSYGDNIIGSISKDYRIPETTLREARRFAELIDAPKTLIAWIANKTTNGHKLYWSDVQKEIGAGSSTKVLTPEQIVNRFVGKAERLGMEMDEVNEQIAALPDDERLELEEILESAAVTYGERLAEFAENHDKVSKLGQSYTPRSKAYLEWIRTCPCAISGDVNVEAHHAVGTKGVATKASDFGAVPLSTELHQEYHNIGHDSFEEKYDVNFAELAFNYLHRHLTGTWITLELPEPC